MSNRRLQTLAAAAFYAACAAYLTWPLVRDLDSTLYGAIGDMTGAMSTFRELVEGGQFPFSPGTLTDFNAPDGLDVRWTLNLMTLPSFGSLYLLTALFGPVAAFGLYTLLGFTLSGVAMFLLVRRLLGHAGVAFVAGYAYAFYPFVVVKAQGHVDFVHGWVLVVALWRLIELVEQPRLRNGVWAGLALVLAFAWTPYHILFAGVTAFAVVVAALFFAVRRGLLRQTVSAAAVMGAIAITWLGAIVLIDHAAERSEVRTHTIQEAIAYSARAEEYVIPTSEHPLFGKEAGEYRASHLHGSNRAENTLYVGATILALALLGLIVGMRMPGPRRRIAVIAAAVAVAGFAFSAPPEVNLLGLTFPTTTQLLFDLTTSWRVFSRLVVVVMLGLVLLASMGLLGIVRRRALVPQALILALALVIVAADLWSARPAKGTNTITVPATYLHLKKLPDGIVVEYPIRPAEESSYGDIFYQGWYDKPILNGYFAGSPEENRALRLRQLSNPATAGRLKALGVRYVLLRRDIKVSGLPDPGRPGRGYRLLTMDPYIALYEVNRSRPAAFVAPMKGFAPAESGQGPPFQWLLEREGTIEVRGSCSPCAGTVRMTVETFARPRTVTVRTQDGTPLVRVRVLRSRTLRFPVVFSRAITLRIETDPGPRSIAEETGSTDPRSVSVSVHSESFSFRNRERPQPSP